MLLDAGHPNVLENTPELVSSGYSSGWTYETGPRKNFEVFAVTFPLCPAFLQQSSPTCRILVQPFVQKMKVTQTACLK
jgi:hypothetical protein